MSFRLLVKEFILINISAVTMKHVSSNAKYVGPHYQELEGPSGRRPIISESLM